MPPAFYISLDRSHEANEGSHGACREPASGAAADGGEAANQHLTDEDGLLEDGFDLVRWVGADAFRLQPHRCRRRRLTTAISK
ncbi:hypothetical protein BRC95_00555 [Halobacteriales archaeon QS_5_68_33]|nr:MAG: hypothetical protein BRC95_00555 [Halobacteriales archaeon QS_5_68_33]